MSLLNITVVFSGAPRQVLAWQVQVPVGARVRAALLAADGLPQALNAAGLGVDPEACAVGVWGHRASLDQVLEPDDRIEIYRPLTVDPKVARRERFKKQGRRTAGLFAKKRSPMAKTPPSP